MGLRIKELMMSLNRQDARIIVGKHALKDKNLDFYDLELVENTMRFGKIFERKSRENKNRICFKKYFKKEGKTYFAVTDYCSDFITLVTVIKKKGKY